MDLESVQNWWGGSIRENERGCYVHVQQDIPNQWILPFPEKERIRRNLRLVYGIGEKTEQQLTESGYGTLDQLASHPRWGRAASEVLRLITENQVDRLRRYGAKDDEIIGFFQNTDLLLLDLETTGFYQAQPLFLIGIIAFVDQRPILVQYVARNYAEEAAALAGFIHDFGAKQLLVSYNGRTFDYPYLMARLRYHGFKEAFRPYQLDLLPSTRQRFRSSLPDCRLRTVETHLLGVGRTESFSGGSIPDLYHRFVTEQNPRMLLEVIEHNAQDLLSMASLTRLLTEGWRKDTGNKSLKEATGDGDG